MCFGNLHRSHCWMERLALTGEKLLEYGGTGFEICVVEEADILLAIGGDGRGRLPLA